ncbi:unnamed protein product [Macrosiphum euphorbiae]|uniref:Uncharacterized protein n=1 Tax=Macrosiphum euphorbiae TaxID=13131 RepID=A0AAV0X885_9HEMI|nr:unnamed protein product [Macrosiphum euphorbiae]
MNSSNSKECCCSAGLKPDGEDEDRPVLAIMNVVKILAIIVVTSVVTLLCIRSGQAMSKTPGTVYNKTGDKSDPRDRGKLSLVTVTSNTVTPKAADGPVDGRQEVRTVVQVVTPEPRREQKLKNENQTTTTSSTITAEPLQLATSRSMTTGSTGENRITSLGPLVSGRRASPIVVRGKLIGQIPHPSNHRGSNGVSVVDDDDDDNEADIIVDADVYHLNNRQMGHSDYSAVDTDISVAEEDGSTGYHDSYDVGYNNRPIGNPNDGTGWSSPGGYGAGVVPTMGRPPYGMAAPYPYPAGHMVAPGYKQHVTYNSNMPPAYANSHRPAGQYNMQSNLHQQVQMIYDKIDWHKVGILALVKVGLAKLKAFGFLKILFLLVFKLKMFLIAMFFKFLLIAKLMKLFKLLMIPLVLITLLPLIMSLFSAPMLVGGILSIPRRIIEFLTEPMYVPATAATKLYTDPTALPGTAVGKNGGLPASLNKPEDSPVHDKRRLEMLELFDPALTVFQKVLDSEKCVERIACRMAVVEKAGILPVWINWMLYRVSKVIPNDKLQSYLKAYSDVNNVIYNKSDNPENWSTWCSDRYDCNITNTTNTATNVIDAVK